jgi:hypothetical protein
MPRFICSTGCFLRKIEGAMISKIKFSYSLRSICKSVTFANFAYAQDSKENGFPPISSPLDQAYMLASPKSANEKTNTYILLATPGTTQWSEDTDAHCMLPKRLWAATN